MSRRIYSKRGLTAADVAAKAEAIANEGALIHCLSWVEIQEVLWQAAALLKSDDGPGGAMCLRGGFCDFDPPCSKECKRSGSAATARNENTFSTKE